MCATRGALVVATSVGVVETLKDQGYCIWNSTMIMLIAQHAKNQMRSSAQAKKLSPSSSSSSSSSFSSSSSSVISRRMENEKQRKAEESLRTVMYLSIWGPNS